MVGYLDTIHNYLTLLFGLISTIENILLDFTLHMTAETFSLTDATIKNCNQLYQVPYLRVSFVL